MIQLYDYELNLLFYYYILKIIFYIQFTTPLIFISINYDSIKLRQECDKIMQKSNSQNETIQIFYTKINKILSELGVFPFKPRSNSDFYFNFSKILDLIEIAITNKQVDLKEKVQNKSSKINHDKFTSLRKHYKLSQIIQAILLTVFRVSQQKINKIFSSQQNLQIFLGSKNNYNITYLQAFLDALKTVESSQSNKSSQTNKSPQSIIQIFLHVKQQIVLSLNEMQKTDKKLVLHLQQNQGNYQYSRKIMLATTVNFNKPVEKSKFLQRIYKSKINEGIIRLLKKINSQFLPFFNKQVLESLIDQVLVTMGMIVFYQSRLNQQEKQFQPNLKNCKKIATIQQYTVTVCIIQNQKSELAFQMKFSFHPKSVKLISQYQFVNDQLILNKNLVNDGLSSKYLCINDLLYQIDYKQNLGKGQFGRIYKGQSFQLLAVVPEKMNKYKQLYFCRKNIAVKVLAYEKEQYENKGFKISQERELLLLNLILDLRHLEKLKQIKNQINQKIKYLKDPIDRPLQGINNLAHVIQIFTVTQQKYSDHQKVIPFLVFEQEKQTLVNTKNHQQIYSQKPAERCRIIYNIFKQIVSGLVCFHYDINQLYPKLLEFYFDSQNSDKNNRSVQKRIISEKMGIMHRDIKPDNIMISFNDNIGNSTVSIIDVGMGKITSVEARDDHTKCGTIYYQAPEVTNGSYYNEKADIWSVGIMLYEMLNKGQKIYRHSTTVHVQQNINKISHTIMEMQKKSKYDKAWFYILRKTLAKNPQKRINARQLLQFMNNNQFYLLQEHHLYDLNKLKIINRISITQIKENDEIDYIRPFTVKYWDKNSSSNTITGVYMNFNHFITATGMSVKQKGMITCTLMIYLAKDNQLNQQNLNTILQSTYFIIVDSPDSKQLQNYKEIFLIEKIENPKNPSLNQFYDSQRKRIKLDDFVKVSYSESRKQYQLIFTERPIYNAIDKSQFYNGYTLPPFTENKRLNINTQIFKANSLKKLHFENVEKEQIYVSEKQDDCLSQIIFLSLPKNIQMDKIVDVMQNILIFIKKIKQKYPPQFKFIDEMVEVQNQKIDINCQETFIKICKIELSKKDNFSEISIFRVKSLFSFFQLNKNQFPPTFQNVLLEFIKIILDSNGNVSSLDLFWKLVMLLTSKNNLQFQEKRKSRKGHIFSLEQTKYSLNLLIGEIFILINKEKQVSLKLFIQLKNQTKTFIQLLNKKQEKLFFFQKKCQMNTPEGNNSLNIQPLNIQLGRLYKKISKLIQFCDNFRQVSDKNTLKNIQTIFQNLKPNLQLLITFFKKLEEQNFNFLKNRQTRQEQDKHYRKQLPT